MASFVPDGAWFRRAEGLVVVLRPCRGLGAAEIVARRQEGDRRMTVGMEDVRLLTRLSRWNRAEELGVPPARLVSLVERDLAFWSRRRSDRDLGGEPLGSLDGPLALRENVSVSAVVIAGADLAPFPEMVRRGDPVEVRGTAFTSLEWDTIVGSVVVGCCPRHVTMARDLAASLDGSREATAIAPDPERRALLAALDDLGLLARHRPRVWGGEPRVTWMGHAGVLIETAGRRILVDTIGFPRSVPTRHPVSPFDPRDLGRLDAVLITHGDNDHFHPGLLYRLPRDTPVVIPSCRDPQPYQVDMRRILALFGFEQVVEVDEWQRLQLGEVTVVATPFRGEDWGLSLPCRTYVVASPGLRVFLNADSTSTPEVYDRIVDEWGGVDLAFLGVTGAEESHVMPPGFGYGEFYRQWIPAERRNEWVQMTNAPRDSAEVACRLRARHAFGYAAGGVPFYSVAYCDRGTHEALAAALAELGVQTRPLRLEVGVPTRIGD